MVLPRIIWKDVPGYEGLYRINNLGTIISYHNRNYGKVISYRIDRANYLTVRLSKCGATSTKYIHRLMAETFIPNPQGKCCVNHINGNQCDNHITNLEWVTHSENMKHAYSIGLCKSARRRAA